MKPERLFGITALIMLLATLVFGLFSALYYLWPETILSLIPFVKSRPLHVSLALYWILSSCIYAVYTGIRKLSPLAPSDFWIKIQFSLWILAIIGSLHAYTTGDFGGREYWEFNPIWSIPLALAWLIMIVQTLRSLLRIRQWPVFVWMWFTGVLFFGLIFLENYLWLITGWNEDIIRDMTIQWKVNGSLVGAWNQMIYGTMLFVMHQLSPSAKTDRSKITFLLYFLGLFNLMFNWGHHVYTLPTHGIVHHLGYAVSMTEWILFLRIFYFWRKTLIPSVSLRDNWSYRFLFAADMWVALNLGQALLMSIPAFNLFTHGTHVTVAHAMGTTIGINSTILLGFYFSQLPENTKNLWLSRLFWLFQGALLVFFLSLDAAGIQKGLSVMQNPELPHSKLLDSLWGWFAVFVFAGTFLLISIGGIGGILLKRFFSPTGFKHSST